jgi:hypothetical protein
MLIVKRQSPIFDRKRSAKKDKETRIPPGPGAGPSALIKEVSDEI